MLKQIKGAAGSSKHSEAKEGRGPPAVRGLFGGKIQVKKIGAAKSREKTPTSQERGRKIQLNKINNAKGQDQV